MVRWSRISSALLIGVVFLCVVAVLRAAAPIAAAGPDQINVPLGSVVSLDGSASSDPDGDPLTFAWKFLVRPAGSAAVLTAPTSATPTFTADRNGSYQIQLTVTAGGQTATDTVTVTTLNRPPVANAGVDVAAKVGRKVKLVGVSSSDPDGDKLTFAWTLLEQPEASRGILTNTAKSSATLLLDRPGTYVAELQVTDPFGASDTDTVEINHVNTAPLSNAGPDQAVAVGASVTLDAGGSSDVDEDTLSYAWTLTKPVGSVAVLSDVTALQPTFSADKAGIYSATLVANDGTIAGRADKVVIVAGSANAQPVAHAGRDQRIVAGQTVHLDGSRSTDANGQALTFTWTLTKKPSGSVAVLSDANAVRPSFVADLPGSYTASLIVTDPAPKASLADTVVLTTANVLPVADAGADLEATLGNPVRLHGSGSTDVNGQELGYGWALLHAPAGSSALLTSDGVTPLATLPEPATVNPWFTPDVAGTYQFQLIVNDGVINSLADTVLVTTGNVRPVANAGPDQAVSAGNPVTLDGSASSDANGDTLTFAWTLISKPAGSAATLSGSSTVGPSFTADVAGTYVIQLRVSDGTLTSAPDTIVVTTGNAIPVANAGPDQEVATGAEVSLTAAGSSDADGDSLTYAWAMLARPAGSTAALSSATAASPTFEADLDGTYAVQLTVHDGTVASAPVTVTIEATPPSGNTDPVADAGPDQPGVIVGSLVVLDGSGSSDPDPGDSIASYAWTLTKPAGSGATLSGADTASPSFTADVAGSYAAQLTVTDTHGASDTDSVDVTANPPASSLSLTPPTLGMLTSATSTLQVALSSAAPAGGVLVTLSSSHPLRASVPANVTVAEGATTANITVTSGTQHGDATITASAPGYGSDTTVVTVSRRTMTLSLESPLVGVGRSIGGTVTLAQPAPAGGVTVNLSSSNDSLATISPASVSIAAAATTASFTVSGHAAGTPTLTGSAAGFEDATKPVTVTTSVINLSDGLSVAPSQTLDLALSLTSPAPAGGVTINLTSADTGIATVSPTAFVPEGAMVPTTNPQVTGVNIGSVQISANAPGYGPDATTVSVTLTMTFTPSSLSVVETTTRNITLNLSAPAPAGFTVNLSTDDTSKATVPATVTFTTGATSATVPVTGVAVGNTTLRANRTGVAEATAAITVTVAPPINVNGGIIGKDLVLPISGSLGAAAPAGNLTVTITSPDSARVLLSTTSTGAGSASITVTVNAGSFNIPTFYVHSLVDSGTTDITVSAPGYRSDTATITHYPSGFGHLQGDISTTSFSPNSTVNVYALVLNPTTFTYYTYGYHLRPGVTVNVPVTSSNTAVGTITTSPVTFSSTTSYVLPTQFDPATAGTTTIDIGTPAGFTTPNPLGRHQLTATVTAPDVILGGLIIGKDLQGSVTVSLQAAPPSPVDITVTVANDGIAKISSDPAVVGGTTVTFTNVSNTSARTLYVQGISVADTTLTATATGYNSDTSTVNVYPTGFGHLQGNITTTSFSPNSTVNVYALVLNPTTLTYYTYGYYLRPGVTVNVPVTSSDTAVGTITTSPLTFSSTTSYVLPTQFDPATAGTTTIDIGTPAGFTTPNPVTRHQLTATVTAPDVILGGLIIGKDLQGTVSVSLEAAPPSPVDITVTVANDGIAKISSDPAVVGGTTVTFTNVSNTSARTLYVQGISVANTTLTASATGYNPDTSTVNVYPTGFGHLQGNISTTSFSPNTAINVYALVLDPTTLNFYTYGYYVRPGVTINVPVTSSNTAVGTITTSPLTFSSTTSYVLTTQFDPATTGTTTIDIGTPAGFTTPNPLTRHQLTATVTAPGVYFNVGSSVIVGKDLQTPVTVYLEAAPPSPVDVIVTSSSSGIVTVSTNATLAGGSSATFTGVTSTTVGTIYVQGRSLNSANLTASAAGYDSGSLGVNVYPSGFGNLSYPNGFTTTVGAANTGMYIYSIVLDPTTLNYYTQQPVRGGLTVSVPVSTDNSAVGVMTVNPMSFGPNTQNLLNQFDPVGVGTTIITVDAPPGFSQPSNYRQATVTVNP